MTRPFRPSHRILLLVFLALCVWGAVHAAGGFLSDNPWRGLVVLGAFGVFLGVWLALLASLRRRPKKWGWQNNGHGPPPHQP